MKDKLNAVLTADHVQHKLREDLGNMVGMPTNIDPEVVKENLQESLQRMAQQGIILPEEDSGFKVGEVKQLWASWSLKQKAKWYFHNKTPIIRSLSNKIRAEIDDYNALVWQLQEEGYEDTPARKEYPPHLIIGPKSIIVSDVQIKPVRGIEFITMDFEIDDIQEAADE